MDLISVVIPAYDEWECIELFHAAVSRVAASMTTVAFEFLFIDDGSTDRSLDVIKELRAADPRVRYVSLSRNFGKEAAIHAGLRHARGDYVALMDVDLQDPPGLIPEMYRRLTEGDSDCAAATRHTRSGEGRLRSWASAGFYRVFNRLAKIDLVPGARDFRLMKRQVVDAVLELSEVNRFSKGLFEWVGFKTCWIEYDNVKRVAGTTKWSMWDLLRYSIGGILDFSTAPLAVANAMGILFVMASFV